MSSHLLAQSALRKEDALIWQLSNTVRDLERQIQNEFRAKYFGECRALLKAMRILELLPERELDQWSADIYRACLQSAGQCAEAGDLPNQTELRRHEFQLLHLAHEGIKPRLELPR